MKKIMTDVEQAAHTPGPWWVQDNTEQDGVGHQLRVDSACGAVADCGRTPFVDDEMRANARLIAAAPEMLEVLEELVFWHENKHIRAKGTNEKKRDAWLAAKAVISKATGGAE